MSRPSGGSVPIRRISAGLSTGGLNAFGRRGIGLARVAAAMPLGGDESAGLTRHRRQAAVVPLDDVRMNRLVREIDQKRPVARRLDEPLDVVGEDVGDVALGLQPLCRRR